MRRLIQVALVVAAIGMTGCTVERAIALKTGAEKFAGQASSAIDAVIDLHVRAALGKKVTTEAGIRSSFEMLRSVQEQDPSRVVTTIPQAFKWVDQHEHFREQHFAQAKELKQAYAEFAVAFERLPEGSALAQQDVACSAALAARLIGYMTRSARELTRSPVTLIREEAEAQLRLSDAAKRSQAQKDWSILDREVRVYHALRIEQDQANLEVVAKLADAAHTGAQVLSMIDKYDDASVQDLMSILKSVLKERESTFGLSSSAQLQRLEDIREKIKTNPQLSGALELAVNTNPAQCIEGGVK